VGLFDKLKEANAARDLRRQNEVALSHYQTELADWQASVDCGQKMLDSLEYLDKGEDAADTSAVMKKGEFAFWIGIASYHESRRQAGTYVGRSKGISIPIGNTGFRYRTGAIKGTFVPGDEVQTTLDKGIVIMTNQRLIFNGNLKTQEWLFSKWTGADASESEMSYMFHVSNRQKTSGLTFGTYLDGQEFNRFLGVALRIERDTVHALVESLTGSLQELKNKRPEQPTPILDKPQA